VKTRFILTERGQPRDLPVQQPTKFELVVNLKTANTLAPTIAPSILACADGDPGG
jgi:putative ABC transport system substrate-binding protein